MKYQNLDADINKEDGYSGYSDTDIDPSSFNDNSLISREHSSSDNDNEDKPHERFKKTGTVEDDQFRLLNDYFRDISSERLLSANEEIEIPAKIRRCEKKIEDISDLLDSRSTYDHDINYVRRLEASHRAYVERARELRKRFANANLRLVISIAKRYSSHGMPFLDLIQEGNIGLMRAIERFDHTKGYRFSTYASWWIYQSITRAILVHKGAVRVPVYLLEVTNRVYKTKSILTRESGSQPEAEEIAESSGVPIKYVKRILKITNESLSLDSPIDGEKRTLYDFIENEDSISPDHIVVGQELKESIRHSLSLLSAKEEEVLRLRFGIDRDETVTLDDIGKKFNLTRERIRQIEKKALRKLSVSKMKDALKNFRS